MAVSTQNAVDQALEEQIRSKPFRTVTEVAELLGISPETVRTRVKAGELAACQPSRQYKITAGALLDFLRTRSERAPTTVTAA